MKINMYGYAKCLEKEDVKLVFTLKEEHNRSWTMISINQRNGDFLSSVRNPDDMTVSNTEGSQQIWFNLKSNIVHTHPCYILVSAHY
jgi:hypothetical protein